MIDLKLKSYIEQEKEWPTKGHFILCQETPTSVVVYQSYKPSIGEYAVKHQKFAGCSDFSLTRMSWIKTNFLWMMYRNGWATKKNQEVVLAIKLKKEAFNEILKNAVNAKFSSELYGSKEEHEQDKIKSTVRLQWDPDHDPNGTPVIRRAIQLGIRGSILEKFANGEIIESILDITDFVKEQSEFVKSGNLKELMIPEEHVYIVNDEYTRKRIALEKIK